MRFDNNLLTAIRVLSGRYVGSYRDYDRLANGTYPHIGSIWYGDAYGFDILQADIRGRFLYARFDKQL